MPRVGTFVPADLRQAEDFAAFRAALRHGPRTDLAFVHAPAVTVAQMPGGMIRGVNLFGPGHSPGMTDNPTAVAATREITTVLLHDACMIDSSLAVLDRDDRVFASGVENIGAHRLAAVDHHFRLDEAGMLRLADNVRAQAERRELVALPVCGAGFPNYGHFLYDGLPAVFMLRELFADLRLRVVGQRLAPWQRDILAALDLERHYLEISRPTVFDAVLASTTLAMHVSYPSACIRPMFDVLRTRCGAADAGGPRKVFLSRAGDTRRHLRNRAAVENMMARRGFAIVQPEHMAFRDQVALMASCRVVAGESGAAMANLGFCAPGVRVLEIQPERFVEGWVRGMCFMLGHAWHVYFARVDGPQPEVADGEGHRFAYDVDVAELEQVVSMMEQPISRTLSAPLPFAAADDEHDVTAVEAFGADALPQRLDLFAAAMSPPPPDLLTSGDAAALTMPDQHHRRQLPAVGVHAVPGCTLGGAGLLREAGGGWFDREDCVPAALRAVLTAGAKPDWLGALGRADAEVLAVDRACFVVLQPEVSYPEFLTDVLPRLYLFATLQRLGRSFPLVVGRDAPEWIRRIVSLYAQEREIIWYDPAVQVVRAPAFIVPGLMRHGHFLHPALNLAADDLCVRAGAAAPATTRGRLYLSYRAYGDGSFSRLDNEEEIAEILWDSGFRTLQPWRMALAEQLAAYRAAECLVSERGAAVCNALFAPFGASVGVIGRPDPLVRAICALRRQRLRVVEPVGGFPADPAARMRVDPAVFRSFLPAMLAAPEEVAAAAPLPARAAEPQPPAAPAAASPAAAAPSPTNLVEALPQGPYLTQIADMHRLPALLFAGEEERPRRPFFHTTPIDPAVAQFGPRFSDPSYRSYRSPRMVCVALPRATAIGATGLVAFGGSLVRDTTHSVDDWRPESLIAHRDLERGVRFKRPIAMPGRHLPGEAFCAVSGGWRNHAHWLTETLPRLYLFGWLRAQVPGLQLLVPDFGDSAVHRRTLELLGIDPAQAIRLAEDAVVTPDRLWNVPVIDLWSVPSLCRIAAQEVAAAVRARNAVPSGAERIYIHRVAGVRRLTNFNAVAPVLAAFGFTVVATESLTLDEQVRLMQGARHVVGEHGAGVANIMFCQPGTRVLELFNPACVQPAHWVMASMCDLEYGYVVGSHVPMAHAPKPDWNTDYAVAPEILAHALKIMLGMPG
jgi:capsular polysaccharide biosynthesis protein